jgi:hypothetical protein
MVFLIRTTIFSVFLSELKIQPDVAYEKQYTIIIKLTLMEFSPVELRASSTTRGPITEQHKPRKVYTINTWKENKALKRWRDKVEVTNKLLIVIIIAIHAQTSTSNDYYYYWNF